MISSNLDTIKRSVDSITKISTSDRHKSLRWLSRQNDLVIYDVFKLQKSHFYQLKSQNTDDDLILLSITSLFLALKETITASNPTKRKYRGSDFGFLRQVAKNRAKQFRKTRKKDKHEKLMDLQSTVLTLIKQDKYSYREVAGYLLKYHGLEVSHTTVGLFYRMLREDKNG